MGNTIFLIQAFRFVVILLNYTAGARLPQLMPMRSGRRSELCPGNEKLLEMDIKCSAMSAISWAC